MSMLTTIERIESVGPEARARRVCFADGSPDRTTSAAAIKLLRVEAGSVVDRDDLLRQLEDAEPQLARDRALQLIGYRERSRHELRDRLVRDGYPHVVANAVVARFCEVELVDDERFAGAWIRSRLASGHGLRRIRRELAEKGVADHVIEEALLENAGDDELARASASLRGRVPRDAKERQRLVRRLVARGFDLRVAVDAVGRVAAQPPPEE